MILLVRASIAHRRALGRGGLAEGMPSQLDPQVLNPQVAVRPADGESLGTSQGSYTTHTNARVPCARTLSHWLHSARSVASTRCVRSSVEVGGAARVCVSCACDAPQPLRSPTWPARTQTIRMAYAYRLHSQQQLARTVARFAHLHGISPTLIHSPGHQVDRAPFACCFQLLLGCIADRGANHD